MVISRTPFRISFFGGGTDYPAWYLNHGGAVLSATVDKFCYLTCRHLPPFFEHRIRVVWSKIENCLTIDEIQHPAVREGLRFLGIDRDVEIHHDGDLPARGGMGSSSSFTVGLLHALYALKGRIPSKHQLATESIQVEQEIIGETVGSQDQVSAAYGGLNHIVFHPNGEISVRPMTLSHGRIAELNDHLMLFYTGVARNAAEVAGSYVRDIERREEQLHRMQAMVSDGSAILAGDGDITAFGELLHEAWQAKRSLSPQVSNSHVDDIYAEARSAGAIGGKLTGAGGGGFVVLFVPPAKQADVQQRLDRLIHVPFKFEFSGTQIIFFDPGPDYSAAEEARAKQSIDAFRELQLKTPS